MSAPHVLTHMQTSILNKLYRKLHLDNEMGNDWLATRNLFDWIRLIRRIDDAKLQKLCGTDIALYIVFLRFSSKFFLVVSLINVISVSLFVTGDPPPKESSSGDFSLKHLTIENCSNT